MLNNFDHDDASVQWDKRVSGEQEEAARQLVETHYVPPGARVLSVWVDSRRARSHASFNWKVVISGEPQTILLKYNPRMQDAGHVRRVASIMQFCSEHGVPCPEILLPLTTDMPFVVGKGGTGLFIAYRFLDGRYFQGEESELKQVGYALGALHRVLGKCPRQNAGVQPWSRSRLTDEFDDLMDLIRKKHNRDDFDSYALERAPHWRQDLASVDALDLRLSFVQLTHHDLHVQNILFQGGKLAALLDFEHVDMAPEPRAIDLAFALHRFVKFYATRRRHEVEATCVKHGSAIFLSEYLRANPELTRKEIRAVPELIRYRAGLGLNATLRQRVLEKVIRFPPEELDKDIHSFREAELFAFLGTWDSENLILE